MKPRDRHPNHVPRVQGPFVAPQGLGTKELKWVPDPIPNQIEVNATSHGDSTTAGDIVVRWGFAGESAGTAITGSVTRPSLGLYPGADVLPGSHGGALAVSWTFASTSTGSSATGFFQLPAGTLYPAAGLFPGLHTTELEVAGPVELGGTSSGTSTTTGTLDVPVAVVVARSPIPPAPGPLTVLITSADGAQYRLGPDEPDAAWVPENITWESVVPGGWKTGSFNLRRRIDEDIPLRLLDEVEIIDEHGQTVYEGRIQKLPRQFGDDFLLGVECLGWAAHLLDDPSFCQIYVDRDISSWGEMPFEEKVRLANGAVDFGSLSWASENGGLVLAFPNQTLGAWVKAEIWYEAPAGVRVALIEYSGAETTRPTGYTAPRLVATQGRDYSVGEVYNLTFDGTVRSQFLTTLRRYISFDVDSAGNVATPAAGSNQRVSLIGVHGAHGLTSAQASSDGMDGYYIDDMLANAISSSAPKLNFTTGEGGSIERPPVVVAQATYPEPGPVENVILDLNKYVLWDWVVYENRTFFYRLTDPDRLCWEARLDQGIHLSLEGDDVEHAYNGCVVKYGLPDGTRRIAGPTGSGYDVESVLLEDTDPENTVNQHGYPRKWIELDISFPTLDDYAPIIGAAYLAQAALPARSGDITLRGEIEHPTMGMRPVREVRAGDWIRLSDHPSDVPRRIISANHSDDERTTTVSVGNDMNKVDAALEQVGVAAKVAMG